MANEYVEKVNAWLNADPSERTIEEGATLMLQGNRNRILYDHVIKKNNFGKVEYELGKIAENNVQNCNEPTVKAMALEVVKNETTQPVESVGKRADHDTLPPEIQNKFDQNQTIYPEMRAIHARLTVLNETGTACDRYPFLKKLLELDKQLRTNWDEYDNFDPNAPVIVADTKNPVPGELLSASRVSANRKFLSINKETVSKLIADGNPDKAKLILDKMQDRYNECILGGVSFSDDQLADLKEIGLIIGETKELEDKPAAGTQVIVEGQEVISPAVTTTEIKEEKQPVDEVTEETPEENVISQIKTLLNNDITKEVIIPTISSLGNFKGLELTPEVVEDLYNKAIDQEMNSVE